MLRQEFGGAVWSPNGKRIAFLRDLNPNGVDPAPAIYTMRADGTGVRKVYAYNYYDDPFDWQARPS